MATKMVCFNENKNKIHEKTKGLGCPQGQQRMCSSGSTSLFLCHDDGFGDCLLSKVQFCKLVRITHSAPHADTVMLLIPPAILFVHCSDGDPEKSPQGGDGESGGEGQALSHTRRCISH